MRNLDTITCGVTPAAGCVTAQTASVFRAVDSGSFGCGSDVNRNRRERREGWQDGCFDQRAGLVNGYASGCGHCNGCNGCAADKTCNVCAAGNACSACTASNACNVCATGNTCAASNTCTANDACNICATGNTCAASTACSTCTASNAGNVCATGNTCAAGNASNTCTASNTCSPCTTAAQNSCGRSGPAQACHLPHHPCVTPGMVYETQHHLHDLHGAEEAIRKGTLFPQLYMPMRGECADGCGAQLCEGQAEAFAAWELRLYLNTHPCDQQALQLFRKYALKADQPNYAGAFAGDCGDRWSWTEAPWPWEFNAGCECGCNCE